MSKKKKKTSDEHKAAGNSRLVVESDAYRPFEDIKQVKPKVIKKTQPTAVVKSASERKDPIVLGYDPKANFGDILSSWEATGELGGVTKRMKSYSKVQVVKSFGEILSAWEGEKAEKRQQAERGVDPIKKSKAYTPKQDFGSLLDQFEGHESGRQPRGNAMPPRIKIKDDAPIKPTAEIEQALEEKDELDGERERPVSWSFADTYRAWNAAKDEDAAIKKARAEKHEKEEAELTISQLRALEPQKTLDLHGMTVLEAEKACADFLRAAKDGRLLKIAIITGKGLHNDKGYSLLKEAALSQIRISNVVREAYTPKAMHGGSGVIWIVLKQS